MARTSRKNKSNSANLGFEAELFAAADKLRGHLDAVNRNYRANAGKCHVSHTVPDTGAWEQKMAQVLEDMDEVICYVKNYNLGFTITYTLNGEEHGYIPDYIVRIKIPDHPVKTTTLGTERQPHKPA